MRHDDDEERFRRAAEGGAGKSGYVREIFSEIAPRYDLLNHLLSFNVDRAWRRRAIGALRGDAFRPGPYLDLCAGTLDISVALAQTAGFSSTIVSVDFAEPMLLHGTRKVQGLRVLPAAGDVLALPLRDGSAAGAIVAFGIRNVGDLDQTLREVMRVLEPGARFVILEFSTPRSPLVNTAYQLYFRHVLPAIGGAISGHRTAYRYLPKSVENFPVTEDLAARMRDAGFINVRWTSLTLGIAAIHVGDRA